MNSMPIVPTSSLLSDMKLPTMAATQGEDMATEFESLVIGQLLKTMRGTSEDGGMFPGDKSDTYGGMFDMYFGKFLAKNGGLGLADFVNKGIDQAIGATNTAQPADPAANVLPQ